MTTKDARELHLDWLAAGNKTCTHPAFATEYAGEGWEKGFTGRTGDSVCTTCGEVFSPTEVDEILRRRNTTQ
ncbi:MAG: hypothetical protein ACJ788_01605 [Ktedonobacteraceae bacterium]